MRRGLPTLPALAGALALAGCPIPQAVPDYPAGTITPPRILVDGVDGNEEAVHFVPASCTTPEPVFPLSARVLDTDTIETIEARWFVNYDARFLLNYRPMDTALVPPDPDPNVLVRQIPQFVFQPYQHPPAPGTGSGSGPTYPEPGLVRVVDLVVSNGFDPQAETTVYPLPFRTPLPGFETQVHRWVFFSVTPAGTCSPGEEGCCPGP
jgi:hypothetical protein